ncbi:MAG: hypothetical protein WCJ87_12530, partial [Burkholderiales bacterium]
EIFDEILRLYHNDQQALNGATALIRESMIRYLSENEEEYHSHLKAQSRKDYEKNKQTLEIMRKSLLIYLEENAAQGVLTDKIKIFNRVRVLEREQELQQQQQQRQNSAESPLEAR